MIFTILMGVTTNALYSFVCIGLGFTASIFGISGILVDKKSIKS
jgi:hypothetical protein